MTIAGIAALVEGDGEVQAVPVVLRRIVHSIDPASRLAVAPAWRHPSGSIRRAGGLERAMSAVATKHPAHAVFVLIDSEDDCPEKLALELTQRARHARPDLYAPVVLAVREYEAWFLAAAESLAGHRGLPKDLTSPPDPEAIRNAKGWLTERMPRGTIYKPTQDQAALSAVSTSIWP